MTVDTTREAWLQHAVRALTPWLEEIEGVKVPELKVSIGWPSHGGLGTKKIVVGECWTRASASDGINQIFISPVRDADTGVEILATLLHEMIHAIDDCESGHKGNFVRISKAMGVVPKWTETNPGPELAERLEGLLERLGPIPHARIGKVGKAADKPPKQNTRMLKLQCPSCEYTARTTQKWIDVGLPTCPCGTEMQEAS